MAYSFLALWWGFGTFVKYIRSQRNRNKHPFVTSTTQPCFCCATRRGRLLPLESFLKVFGLGFHAFVEIYTGIHFDQRLNRTVLEHENSHHVCMLSGFIVQGVVELLIYYRVPFPKKTEFFFAWIGFLIQALIMSVHLNGDPGLEYEVHKLWTVLIVLTWLSATVECYMDDNIWPVFARILFFLAQGTWLMQVAFVVWPHTTNPMFIWKNDHASHVWLSISLMYHILGAGMLLLAEYALVYAFMDVFDRCYDRYELDLESRDDVIQSGKVMRKTDLNNHENHKEYSFLIDEEEES